MTSDEALEKALEKAQHHLIDSRLDYGYPSQEQSLAAQAYIMLATELRIREEKAASEQITTKKELTEEEKDKIYLEKFGLVRGKYQEVEDDLADDYEPTPIEVPITNRWVTEGEDGNYWVPCEKEAAIGEVTKQWSDGTLEVTLRY